MTPPPGATLYLGPGGAGELAASLDPQALEILERRRDAAAPRRGWLMRRFLLTADVVALTVAFLLSVVALGGDRGPLVGVDGLVLLPVLGAALVLWVVAAKLRGLYEGDEERTDHSTLDEVVAVFGIVSTSIWLVFALAWLVPPLTPDPTSLVLFWALAVTLVPTGRAVARGYCRQNISYLQNTVIVGAGDIGQLVARKLLQHPEYGINLVGFIDADPRARRPGLDHLAVLGDPARLPEIVRLLEIERVVVAFSGDSHEQTLELIRSLKHFDVQVDIVPRLFEVLGPNAGIHSVEGLPLIGLPQATITRSSRLVKRAIDITGATLGLLLTAPLLLVVALLIKRDSEGPVLFRQTRLGREMREFTIYKFRTMRHDVDNQAHREFIEKTMSADAAPETNGLYKLERDDAVTRVGRWLRKTSLDELPQLLNVLRGDMSLVGPRPCLGYETEHFAPHHFERFKVPAGITGLWQVTARARSTFGEALDMDVAYARSWSLGLDLRLLFRTPVYLLRRGSTA